MSSKTMTGEALRWFERLLAAPRKAHDRSEADRRQRLARIAGDHACLESQLRLIELNARLESLTSPDAAVLAAFARRLIEENRGVQPEPRAVQRCALG